MASDDEDDDLANLRQAALKTLKPKAQPIQQVINVSNLGHSQQNVLWQDYPASADVAQEFQFHPEPLELEQYSPRNNIVPLSTHAPILRVQGLHPLPSQQWQQPYQSRMPGFRNFQQRRPPSDNRGPFTRGPRRTFGDRGRSHLDTSNSRFPRRGYMSDRGGRGFFHKPKGLASSQLGGHKPFDTDGGGGNLIVLTTKELDGPAQIAKDKEFHQAREQNPPVQGAAASSKLSLPQDKYHSPLFRGSAPKKEEEELRPAEKTRDKFSRYDRDSDEEEEENDVDDITSEIDKFLNSTDSPLTVELKERDQSSGAVPESELSQHLNVPDLDISDIKDNTSSGSDLDAKVEEESDLDAKVEDESDLDTKLAEESDLDTKAAEDSDLDTKLADESDLDTKVADESDLDTKVEASPIASDVESLDLDALATGELVFEEDLDMTLEVKSAPLQNSRVGEKENRKSDSDVKFVTKEGSTPPTTSQDPAHSSKSLSSSSSSTSSSSSDSNDSSDDEENQVGNMERESADVKAKNFQDEIVHSPTAEDEEVLNILPPEDYPQTRDSSPSACLKNTYSTSLSKKSTSVSLSVERSQKQSSHSPKREHVSDSISPKSKSRRQRSLSPRIRERHQHKAHGGKRISPWRTVTDRERLYSPREQLPSPLRQAYRRPASPGQGLSSRERYTSGRTYSPKRCSPRERSSSPRGRPSQGHRTNKGRSPLHRSRSPSFSARRGNPEMRSSYERYNKEQKNFRSGDQNKSTDIVRFRRSRSRSTDRHPKQLEVRPGKHNPNENQERDNSRKERSTVKSPLMPQIDLDKLTAEEREKIEARRRKFESNQVTIDPSKKVSLKSIKERPKKQKKLKEVGASKDLAGNTKMMKSISNNDGPTNFESKHTVTKCNLDSLSDSKNSNKDPRLSKPVLLSVPISKRKKQQPLGGSSASATGVQLKRKEKGNKLALRKDVREYIADHSQTSASNLSHREDSPPTSKSLSSSIVRSQPYKANIPIKKLKIEIQVSPTEKRSTSKPDFSKVYSVPAKRPAKSGGASLYLDEEEIEAHEVLRRGKVKRKKKKQQDPDVIFGNDESRQLEPTVESAKPTKPSIMDRLGKKIPLSPQPPGKSREKKKKRKHAEDEPITELDVKIQKIKEKNAAIARRQLEIEQDKKRYG